jgi:hypothetical protein
MNQREERQATVIKALRLQLEKQEQENGALRKEIKLFSYTIQEAVKEERQRNMSLLDQTETRHDLEMKHLSADLTRGAAASNGQVEALRIKFEEVLRRKLIRQQSELEQERREALEALARRHNEGLESRRRLFEQETRVLLDELNRLRRRDARVSVDLEMVSEPEPHHNTPPKPHTNTHRPRPPTPSHHIATPPSRSPSKIHPRALSPSPVSRKTQSHCYSNSISPSSADKQAMPARTQLSRMYVSELDNYIQKSGISPSASRSPSKNKTADRIPSPKRQPSRRHDTMVQESHDSASSLRNSSVYRYPTPPEYKARYEDDIQEPISSKIESSLEGKHDRPDLTHQGPSYADKITKAFRFPKPPEFEVFYEQHGIEVGDADISEAMLDDRLSVLSYSSRDSLN